MNRRQLACAIAEAHANDEETVVKVATYYDGVVTILRGMEETAFRVLAECEEESEESAIGWSKDRSVWCVTCAEPAASKAVLARLAEELHLYDGLETPLAREAGIVVTDEPDAKIESLTKPTD